MKKVILEIENQNYWCVGQLYIYIDDQLSKIYKINKFYKVTEDWFFIYGESGGSGYGYKPGDILHKIKIDDAEFDKKHVDKFSIDYYSTMNKAKW